MAFFQEQKPAHEPAFRAPASVLLLIAALVAAHAGRVLSSNAFSDRILNDYALNPAVYLAQYPDVAFDRLIMPFSHMFLHADWTHLAVNCVWLLAFGPVIARRFGGPAFLVFFLLCGLVGALFFVVFEWVSASARSAPRARFRA
ncbi:MAG: rhomboid family intramembrane serine protease [Rhizomicrobium sp.]